MSSFFAALQGPYQGQISYESFTNILNDGKTRLICFGGAHATALRDFDPQRGSAFINLPFTPTIGPLIKADLDLELKEGQYNYYARIIGSVKFITTNSWIQKRREHVYIRDLLSLSCALSFNFHPAKGRTRIGQLEYEAKYERNEESLNLLVDEYCKFIANHPYYRAVKTICPVPSSPNSEWPITHFLADRIAERLSITSLTNGLHWGPEKRSMKSVSIDRKWRSLANAGLFWNEQFACPKSDIILIDDLYQSGITINFVGGFLLDSGAKKIFGLSGVKSLRNSDNA